MIRCTCEYLIHDGEVVLRVDDPECIVHLYEATTIEATC